MTYRLIRTGACVTAFAAMMASPVLAQELAAEPTFANLTLKSGFEPDPHRIELTAGGDIDAASSIGSECVGMIAGPPDIRLTYHAGEETLRIRAKADADTTLVINGPNGEWACNDDADDNFNPEVVFINTQEGVYDIWVGTFDKEPVAAVVEITELY